MFSFFSKRPTTKADVVLAVLTALFSAYKAYDTINDYKTEQKEITA